METALLSYSSSDQPSSSAFPTPSSSPSSSADHVIDVPRKYDVFFSFRGEDTRKNIMGHLRAALSEKQIETFVDDDKLERGQFISPQLLEAIENSICSVVILSPNYASSTWCLDELVKILDCMKTKGQIVIPIFYHVDPSDVRKQTSSFGEAMAKHEMNLNENPARVENWRAALGEVTNLAGLDLKNYRDEANFVREIVEQVSCKLASSKSVEDAKLGGFFYSCGFHVINFIMVIIGILLYYCVTVPLILLFVFKIFYPILVPIIGSIFQLILGDDI